MAKRPRYANSGAIFEKRGDPWMTDKEGVRLFGRNLYTEDPDYDRYFAKEPQGKNPDRIVKAKKKKVRVLTDEERMLNLSRKNNKEIEAAQTRDELANRAKQLKSKK